MIKFNKQKLFTIGTYVLLFFVFLLLGLIFSQNNKTNSSLKSFFEVAESRSFDFRQTLKVYHKKQIANQNIVVLAIDDASLEYLWGKYGEWPVPRKVYADLIEHIEKTHPKAIVFDLMFIKSMRSAPDSDKALVSSMNKYSNIITGMTFDDQPYDIRIPQDIPERLALNVENNSNTNISVHSIYKNVKPILQDLINGNVKIGFTNVLRSKDGILRKVSPMFEYKENYYPYLSFLAGLENTKNKITIDKNGVLKVNNLRIPLTEDGEAILNWYGPSGTHQIYPLYKITNEIDENKITYNFKDKIVIIGTTAMTLHDTKSVPIQNEIYPGVEVHATFLNNMIDNNFIQKTCSRTNLCIALFVLVTVSLIVMFSTSTFFAVLSTLMFGLAYLLVSYYVMSYANLWIPVVMPVISMIIGFIISILIKYLIKSRDFEYQYKLATIDGLTELYNHRYFQEMLKKQMDIATRYQQKLSLMIIDIDFFKKFNDTYGHQSGDAVLRQVAERLKKTSRTTDYVCRYGGEEMSIILPNTSEEEAMNTANRILNAISSKEFHLSSTKTGNVTVSIGVATFPTDSSSPQELIEFADKGLYYAKEHGRNQVGKIKEENK